MEAKVIKTQTSFRLSEDLLGKLKKEAKKANRSLNNYVECILMDSVYNEPNKETREAIKEAREGKSAGTIDMTDFSSFINSINDIE